MRLKSSQSSLFTSFLAISVLFCAPACKKDEGEKAASPTERSGKEGAATKPAAVTELTIYSGRGEKLVGPSLAAYEKKSGVKLKIKYADTSELAAALLDEGGSSPADVFIAQDAGTLGFLAAKSLFAPLPEAVTARAADGFRSKDGSWIGLTGRARVLAYNTGKLRPEDLPKSASELTDKKWKGRVGWAPANASFQAAVAAMVQLEGAESAKAWLTAMKANKPKDYPKNTPAVMAVSRGEVDVALVNHYYLYRLRAEHGEKFPVENHYFKDGKAHSMVNLSGAAVIKSSKKQEAAAALIEFLLSPEGQKSFVEDNHEFPVGIGVKSPSGLPAVEALKAPAIDLAQIRDLKATNDLLRETKVIP